MRNTRTREWAATVTTSPGRTDWLGRSARCRLTRTLPPATSAAAIVRVFTTRANQSHLSSRCASDMARRELRETAHEDPCSWARFSRAILSAPRAAKGESGSTSPRLGGADRICLAGRSSARRCSPPALCSSLRLDR